MERIEELLKEIRRICEEHNEDFIFMTSYEGKLEISNLSNLQFLNSSLESLWQTISLQSEIERFKYFLKFRTFQTVALRDLDNLVAGERYKVVNATRSRSCLSFTITTMDGTLVSTSKGDGWASILFDSNKLYKILN